jgi:N-acetylglucosaminyl-diphospho-decaprenol L-rhamnosyltransferase
MHEIIVVDNASSDSSLKILNEFGDKIKVIANKENVGFGRANNQAVKEAISPFIFLLNPDTQLQHEGDLSEIVQFSKDHPQYGLVGTRIIKTDGKTETIPKKYYPGEKHIGFPFKNLPGNIAWLLGACMMIPRNIYINLNGFDEDYFLYAEDIDLCLRIRKLGHEIGYLEAVAIIHVGGASEKATKKYELTMKKQRALYKFYNKFYKRGAIRHLVTVDLKRAKFRKLFHKLRLKLGLKASHAKLDHYQAVYDSSKNFLDLL